MQAIKINNVIRPLTGTLQRRQLATRIIRFTARPGTIAENIQNDLPRPRVANDEKVYRES